MYPNGTNNKQIALINTSKFVETPATTNMKIKLNKEV
jgi:hypothetical protein